MSDNLSDRRLVENEIYFRKLNETVQARIDEVQRIAAKEGHRYKQDFSDFPFQFYCECSDMGCVERIQVTLDEYKRIHQKRNRFLIRCGHESKTVERVKQEYGSYCVVEKYVMLTGV